MLVYYKLSGIIADIALALNLYILLGTLAWLNFTLTLPGIAGMILTVGMAVDANVIIFERIREEIRSGKTVMAAIQAGYEKAFRTILDANITTLIATFVLSQFGSGPIRGFAITLSIGIVINMFTSLFVTRLLFAVGVDIFRIKKLSI
jgi:preprotein translocase subunit SecD